MDQIPMQRIKYVNIGIYIGSFDPFHRGHQAICDHLIDDVERNPFMDNECVTKIYILPNVPSKSKPNRSKLEHRIDMISLQLDGSKNYGDGTIIVSPEPADQIVTELRKDPMNRLSLIIGSDRYFECIDKNKRPLGQSSQMEDKFDRYIVIQRRGLKDRRIDIHNKNSAMFFNRPCKIYTNVEFQDGSSTDVRSGALSLVNSDVIQYIQNNHLYEISRIQKIFPSHKQLSLCESLSGNSVYQIVVMEGDVEVTKYVKIGYHDDMKQQVDAYDYFGDLKAEYVDNNILVMEKASGYRLTDILNDKFTSLQFYKFAEVGEAVGKYIKKLHMTQTFDTDVFRSKFYEKICKQCSTSSDLSQFKTDPGRFRLVHGDLSPNNIFVDPLTMKVTLIDMDRFVDTCKSGGSASYEYFQLLSGINWVCHKYINLDNFRRGFISGYGDCRDVAPDHVYRICKELWCKKGSLMV